MKKTCLYLLTMLLCGWMSVSAGLPVASAEGRQLRTIVIERAADGQLQTHHGLFTLASSSTILDERGRHTAASQLRYPAEVRLAYEIVGGTRVITTLRILAVRQ